MTDHNFFITDNRAGGEAIYGEGAATGNETSKHTRPNTLGQSKNSATPYYFAIG